MLMGREVSKAGSSHESNESGLFPGNVVLLTGSYPGPIPRIDSIQLTLDRDQPCGLVVLLPGADVESMLQFLASQGRLAIPIADLTGGGAARADFCADFPTAEAITDALAKTQRIRQSLCALTPVADQASHERMAVLRLAYSRQTDIKAHWDPESQGLVDYPLLGGIRDSRSLCEQLARAGLLSRSFFDRLHNCGSCGSSRLPVREVCVSCGSADLHEEALIHHYRCACQAPRSNFEHGQDLVCPKCNRILRHYGVDYDAPGLTQQCNQCDEIFSEASVAFKCVDCGSVTPGDDVSTTDWHHYNLTAEGRRVAALGQLPSLELESFVSDVRGHRAPRDLALLIDFEDRVHRRYHRPFSVVTISFLASDGVQSVEQLQTESMVWDIIRSALRETDFIAALEHQLVLLLPETEPTGAGLAVQRINKLLADTTSVSAQVRAEVLADEKIPALIEIMRRA